MCTCIGISGHMKWYKIYTAQTECENPSVSVWEK